MRKTLLLMGFSALAVAVSAGAQIAEGDRQWSARAEGHVGGHAQTTPIDRAIAAYQIAIGQDPNDLEARGRLLRAYRYKGAYVATTADEKKRVYTQARSAGDEALVVADRVLRARGLRSLAKATERQVADVGRSVPGAGATFLWDSINWGEWALVYGKLAAVRQGAADRIRREATIAMLIDPKLEGGAPSRVLGRLHDQTPHVPFLTGWASSSEAVRLLNDSLRIDPNSKITRTFLAEAMVNDNGDTRKEAAKILHQTITAPDDPAHIVEEQAAAEEARALLRKWEM